MVPPRMAQNPIGINSREIGRPVRAAIRDTTGKNNAAAPTFCMNDEINPTVADTSGMIPRSPLGRQMMTKLKVYSGPEHPHGAQQPMPLDLAAMNPKNKR